MTVPDLSKINLADWLAAGSLRNQSGEADRVLLQRCATVRTFDRALYDQELSRGLTGAMSFEALTAHPAIQRLPGDVERYQMRASFRAETFEGWWSDGAARAGEAPPALKEFSCRLAEYYSALAQAPTPLAARQDLEIERMVHLVACDPDQAGQLFTSLFDAAEQRFDLPRCLELIRALEERRTMLGPALAARLTTARRRLNTRSMWAQEYYQTAFYLEREATKSLLDELLAGQAPPPAGAHWVLQLYAPGGMGKSMYLRAVIARHCVEREIPCARLDFDYLDHLAALMREPWRLLLQMAYQLDIQLTGQPFQGYLLDNAPFIPLGGYRPTSGAQPLVTLSADEEARKAEQVVEDFCRIAVALFQQRPVVLIFDTVEQLRHLPPLPNQPDSLGGFFAMLQTLHARLPGLRVLLAGRFDLRTPVDGMASSYTTHFQGQERTVELGGFSRAESMTYLEERRRMRGDPRLEMVVEKAGGNPFKLALLADVLRDVPEITVDELAAYPDADLIYLIERIILRIDKRLRWLLRYGVAPRLLTRDFVLEVMAPYLVAAMQGESEDDPSEDDLPPRVLDKQPFPVEPEAAQLDIAGLWDSLIRYAGRSSWVSTVSERPDAVVFHPEVLEPMRNLIRTQPVYQELHGAAAAYFRKRAEQAPAQRAEWLAHAVYHTYIQADAYALSLLRGPDAAVAEATAMLLLNPRAVDEPFTADAGVMAQANYVMAYRRLHAPDAPDLTEVERWLRQAESYNQTRPVLRPAQLAYGRAALALRQGRPDEAAALARGAIPLGVDKTNLFDLRLTYAQALAALRDPQALDAYRAAWEMAWAPGRMQMAGEFMAALEAGEALEEALQRIESWQEHAQGDPAAQGRSLLAQVQVNLTLGREAAAAEVAQHGQDPTRWSGIAPAVAGYWQGRLRLEAE
ncbi:MAG TPA: hypothetical protein VNK95_23045, partial [Caldilineaceae bacterium]|nr:hypothetical protein [Caldilineaceae bacterium]